MTESTAIPRTAWTAAEIMAMDFPEPRWAVPGVIAEGVTLLAGAPNIGKSWLSLNLSTAVALGGKALGRLDVECGDVLYLALEDNPRRLQSRLGKVLNSSVAPERLTFAFHCEPLPAGGTEWISAWLDSHPDARLVVVDVFARVRGSAPQNMSSYDADYLAMGALKRLADRYGVAILVVHHTREAASEDFLDAVSGSNGLAGSADAVLVLKRSRGKAAAELHVTGRDVEESEYALDFDPRIGAWQMLDGPASDYSLGDTRRLILDHLRIVGASSTGRRTTSSRRLSDGVFAASEGGSGLPWPDPVSGETDGGLARGQGEVLGRDRQRDQDRGRLCSSARVRASRVPLVPPRWRRESATPRRGVWPLLVVLRTRGHRDLARPEAQRPRDCPALRQVAVNDLARAAAQRLDPDRPSGLRGVDRAVARRATGTSTQGSQAGRNDSLREYVQERLAGDVRLPDGTIVGPPGPAWKGRNKPHRGHRRWATSWSPQ